MYTSVTILVEDCTYSSVKLSYKLMATSYLLGDPEINKSLPTLTVVPDCGAKPAILSFTLVPLLLPEGVSLDQLLSLNEAEGTLSILATDNLSLSGLKLTADLTASIQDLEDMHTTVEVSYTTNGPSFTAGADIKSLTCSSEDIGWSLKLPEIVGASQ